MSALAVVGIAVLGVLLTFAVSLGASRGPCCGARSRPSAWSCRPTGRRKSAERSTPRSSTAPLYVLWRAIVFALPAGAVIWLIANVTIGGTPIAEYMVDFLNPLGVLIGLNGVILVAYIVAIPANEIVIPTILMLTVLVSGHQRRGRRARA